jgi:hypothetical protein
MVTFTSPPLGTSATARELRLSESRVRQLAAEGRLRAIRTDAGQLLFDPADVAIFRDERARRSADR